MISSRRRSPRSLLLGGLAALIVAALLQGATAFAAPSQTAIVRPDPLVAAAPVGGQVVVNIYIQDVQNLYGADIRFSYDPAVLEVQDADPAASGVQFQPLRDFLETRLRGQEQGVQCCRSGGPGLPARRDPPVRGDAGQSFDAGERLGRAGSNHLQAAATGRHHLDGHYTRTV